MKQLDISLELAIYPKRYSAIYNSTRDDLKNLNNQHYFSHTSWVVMQYCADLQSQNFRQNRKNIHRNFT